MRGAVLVTGAVLLSYIIAANWILETRWLRERVGEGPDRQLEYAGAYSLWPGRVVFRDLTISAQDHSIQFAIHIPSGSVDVSLLALARKRFEASRLRASALSFRLRTKVRDPSEDVARVSAYPPIAGYADPPLSTGPKPPPIPDDEYDLWEIALDDVDVELAELWLLEYRFLGQGRVTGGFELRPARSFEVFPARAELEGAVHLGGITAVRGVVADIDCSIAHTDVGAPDAPPWLQSISGRADLDVDGVDLGALELYLPAWGRAGGVGHGRGTFAMVAGELSPGGRLDASVLDASLGTSEEGARGRLFSTWRTTPDGAVEATLFAPWLELGPWKSEQPARLVHSGLQLELAPSGPARRLQLAQVVARVPKLEAPALRVAGSALRRAGVDLQLNGRLDAGAELRWEQASALSGSADMRIVGGAIEHEELGTTFAARAEVRLAAREDGAPGSGGEVQLELDGVRIQRSGRDSEPFRAALRTTALDLQLGPEPSLEAPWRITAAPAEPLLSLAFGAPLLEELIGSLLSLDRLDADARLAVDERGVRVDVENARSGGLSGRGFWHGRGERAPSGAFLLATSVTRVGIELQGSEVDTELSVEPDWLSQRSGR